MFEEIVDWVQVDVQSSIGDMDSPSLLDAEKRTR